MSQQENDLNNLTDKQLAVNLTIVDQDAVHGWGKGGVDVRDFYHKRRSLSQHASRRVRNIAYESFGVNVFLSDASIMKVFEELLPVMGSVKEHMSSLQEKKKVVAVAEHHHMDVRSAKNPVAKSCQSRRQCTGPGLLPTRCTVLSMLNPTHSRNTERTT